MDEVAIALVVLRQQSEVVVELLAALGIATGIIDAPASGGSLVAAVVGHVGLGADDRLYALLATLLVEVENAVHVAVVGDAEPGLAILNCLRDEFVESRCTIEHRELGVNVQVGERVAHGREPPWQSVELQDSDELQQCDSATIAAKIDRSENRL